MDVKHRADLVRPPFRHHLATGRRMPGTYESISLGGCQRTFTDQQETFWIVPQTYPVRDGRAEANLGVSVEMPER